MQAMSDEFLAELRGSHQLAARAVYFPPTGGTVDVPIGDGDGSVTIDRKALHRRSGSLVVPIQRPITNEDLTSITSYGGEFLLERGIVKADGSNEYASLGYMRVDDVEWAKGDSELHITLADRSTTIADEVPTTPISFPGTTVIEDAIETIIKRTYPTAIVHQPGATDTFGKVTVVEDDPWQAVTDWAKSLGDEVFCGADGEWYQQAIPTVGTVSVYDIDASFTGVLIDATAQNTRQGVYNGVIVSGEPADNHAPVWALVTDDDPDSPTYWLGAFGQVPTTYTSELIRGTAAALRAGTAQLAEFLGAARTINLTLAPNPALEPGDTCLVTYPEGTSEYHLIDDTTIPLTAEAAQTITSRAFPA